MTEKKKPREWFAEVGPEDGQDPREFHRKVAPKPKNRKALQLCAQVRESLMWILGTECNDEVLASLDVIDVQPFPTSARVLVTVAPALSAEVTDPATILERLHAANGLLRSAVARAVHRKKVPELLFTFRPRDCT